MNRILHQQNHPPRSMNLLRIEDPVLRRNHDLQIAPLACLAEVLNLDQPRRGRHHTVEILHRLRIIRRSAVIRSLSRRPPISIRLRQQGREERPEHRSKREYTNPHDSPGLRSLFPEPYFLSPIPCLYVMSSVSKAGTISRRFGTPCTWVNRSSTMSSSSRWLCTTADMLFRSSGSRTRSSSTTACA